MGEWEGEGEGGHGAAGKRGSGGERRVTNTSDVRLSDQAVDSQICRLRDTSARHVPVSRTITNKMHTLCSPQPERRNDRAESGLISHRLVISRTTEVVARFPEVPTI